MHEFMHQKPWSDIIDHINAMAMAILEQTGRHGLTRISLKNDVGLSLGIAPGTSWDIHTAAGSVEVYCEATPRFSGTFTIE